MKRSSQPFAKFWSKLPFSRSRTETVAERRRKRRAQMRQGKNASRLFPNVCWRRVLLATGTTVLLSLLLCIHLLPNRVPWKIGDTAQWEVIAPRTVRYEDTAATERLRNDEARKVEERYDPIPGAKIAAQDGIEIIFNRIEEALRGFSPASSAPESAAPATESPARTLQSVATEVVAQIRRESEVAPAVEDVIRLMKQPQPVRKEAREVAAGLVDRAMSRAITDETSDLKEAREELFRADGLERLSGRELRETVASLAGTVLSSNRRVNKTETDRQRADARATIPPQMRRLPAGTVVIRPGERVNQEHLDQFKALGLQNSRLDALTVAVISTLVMLLVVLAAVYLRRFHAELYQDTRRLFLLCILTVLSVLGLKLGSSLLGLSAVPGIHFGYLGMMCVASAGMVIALLLSPRVALLIVALLSVASGLVLNNELRFTVITLGSSLVGIISISSLKNRGDLLRAALIVCGANVLLNVLVGHLESDQPQEILMGALWGIVSGVFALALFYFGVAAFEKPFGITTHLRLLELTDPATPILQEFRLKVPGTYAHSLMVSNLAHAAAEAIGADALLVRVAAYYHDLGKMNRPEFFIENQSNAENIHDRIAPSLSAIILASHVKEGVEIAQELGLPPLVVDLIREHHGTSLMRYFYHRATGGLPDPTLEAQFRYAGPKPQTKESAILMIADSVEAASRTLVRPTPARITDFVSRIVEEKRSDGQLDECGLTLQDLKVIQEAISRTLSGALHARVEYPGNASAGNGNRAATPIATPVSGVAGVSGVASVGSVGAGVSVPATSLTSLALPHLNTTRSESEGTINENGNYASGTPRSEHPGLESGAGGDAALN